MIVLSGFGCNNCTSSIVDSPTGAEDALIDFDEAGILEGTNPLVVGVARPDTVGVARPDKGVARPDLGAGAYCIAGVVSNWRSLVPRGGVDPRKGLSGRCSLGIWEDVLDGARSLKVGSAGVVLADMLGAELSGNSSDAGSVEVSRPGSSSDASSIVFS